MAKSRQQSFLFSQADDESATERPEKDAKAEPGSQPDATVPAKSTPPDRPFQLSDLNGKTVVVIDSHSLIYQVFHAMAEMTSPDGRPVNALYGFTRDLLDILKRYQPDFLFCAFDLSEITFRNELYDQYKAHRDPMPEALRAQIPEIHRMVTALTIPILELDGYEADDILATVAKTVDGQSGNCLLVTSDKDCRQLITDRVQMLNLRKNQVYGAEELQNDWGIRPDQVVDFQSMVGDSVDNVPGIPTIGPKTATQLLEQFGTLDAVLASTDQIKGKKAERIAESADLARLSRQLVRLDNQTPIEIDWQQGRVGEIDTTAALELCQEFGFRSLSDRISELGSTTKPAPVQLQQEYQTIDNAKNLQQLVNKLARLSQIAVDTETTSTNPRRAKLVGISLAWEQGRAVYAPFQAPAGEAVIDQDVAIEILKPVLESETIEKIGQNLKYDMVVLRGAGLNLQGPLFDTMVADYLINPGETSHSIDDLAKRYLNYETTSIKQLIGTGSKQIGMNEVPVDQVTHYACEDVDVPLRLYPLLKQQLDALDLTQLFDELEMPLVHVLAELEFNGIAVDTELLSVISDELAARQQELQQEIWSLADGPFNIDSPKQLATVLFDQLGLPVIKKTKTGRSTDVYVLDELASQHRVPALVVEYRQCGKLKSTYTDALVREVNPETGRVHTSFKQDVARTGRLSSKEPNLQNIPIRTAQGRRIRQAFVPGRPGWKLLTADYSQIELRMLAHFCGDRTLADVFAADEDIHSAVAAQVYEVPLNEVDKDMRRRAKVINFGVIYGQSAFGLARELGISREDAESFIDAYFQKYTSVDEFMNEVLVNAHSKGYVSTVMRRRRSVEGVRNPLKAAKSNAANARFRNSAERIAINTVIQGSAADLIKLAMIRVQQRLESSRNLNASMLLQIHDELVFEVAPDSIESLAGLVREEMSNAIELRVPLKVDIEVGDNWGQTEPFGC